MPKNSKEAPDKYPFRPRAENRELIYGLLVKEKEIRNSPSINNTLETIVLIGLGVIKDSKEKK